MQQLYSNIVNNQIYRIEPFIKEKTIIDKIKLSYFEQIIKFAYENLNDIKSSISCINAFDCVSNLWYNSSDLFISYYDFDFTQFQKLMLTPEYNKIFKVCLLNQ